MLVVCGRVTYCSTRKGAAGGGENRSRCPGGEVGSCLAADIYRPCGDTAPCRDCQTTVRNRRDGDGACADAATGRDTAAGANANGSRTEVSICTDGAARGDDGLSTA